MEKNLLVVIDMQNDFITGVLRNEDAMKIVPYVREKVEAATKDNETCVVFTRDTHENDYMDTIEGKKLPVPHCIVGTEGHDIIPELKEYVQDGYVFNKNTFGSTALAEFMNTFGKCFKKVTFIGVCTEYCVLSNVIVTKAMIPNVEIVVDAAGCAGAARDAHDTALKSMKTCHIEVENEGKEAWRQ